MAGPQLELMPGETMILHSHPHWWFFWKQVAAGVGVIALLVLWVTFEGALSTFMGWLALLAFIVWVMNTIYQFFAWQTTRFAITDQRVAYQSGFWKRRGVSIPLNRVNNVNFQQNLMARLLDNGVVTIESAGQTGDSVFENIPKPEYVRNTIFAQVEADEVADSHRDAAALRDAMRTLPTDGAPPPPPAPQAAAPIAAAPTPPAAPTTTQRLEQLTQLRDNGLVTPEEFEAKRQEILGDL